MEHQIQALERLVKSERGKLNEAFVTQKKAHLQKNDHSWQVKLEAVSRTSEDQMEQRLKLLTEQEVELDELIVADAEAFIDMKNEMESNIAVLSDQIQFLEAIHQLNEVSTFGLLGTIVLDKCLVFFCNIVSILKTSSICRKDWITKYMCCENTKKR